MMGGLSACRGLHPRFRLLAPTFPSTHAAHAQRTRYTLTALLAELDPQVVAAVKDCDDRIRRKKQGACGGARSCRERFTRLRYSRAHHTCLHLLA